MGKFLDVIGAFAFKKPWLIIASWLVVLGLLGGLAAYNYEPTSNAISIPGTEAQKAIDRAGEIFPDSGGGSGRIVFKSQDGPLQDDKTAINTLLEEVKGVDGVATVATPFMDESLISASGDIGIAQVQLTQRQGSVDPVTIERVTQLVDDARSDDLTVEIGGDLINNAPEEILGIGEVGGVLIAVMVLIITLGSLVAAGMPVLSALLGVGVSVAGLFSLSAVLDINSTTPVLAVMLGLAVGIDYTLFIVSKYRALVRDGMVHGDAARRAIGTAGNAVVFAALTVIIALAALSVVNIPFMTMMGLTGAASIAVAALVSITLTPALLGLFKAQVFARRERNTGQAPAGSTIWHRWIMTVTKWPLVTIGIVVLVIGAIALPAKDLQLGLPTDQYAASDTTQKKAYDLLSEGFGEGYNGSLLVVVEGLPQVSEADREAVRTPALEEFKQQSAKAEAAQRAQFQQMAMSATTPAQQLALQQQIARAQTEGETQKQAALQQIDKTVEQYAKFVQLNSVADTLKDTDNVASVLPASVTSDGTKGLLQVIPESAPSSQATSNLIAKLRTLDATSNDQPDTTLAVTGSTALQDDINDKLSAALPLYLAVVVGLSLVLLVIAFRSLLVPLKATLGFLLSVLAMFGALVAVFQWGWFGIAEAPGPIVSFIPIIAIGILFGLAMDYQFFLVSGMHESYTKSRDAKRAVIDGFTAGSKVVTAAAIIMVSVFAGFIFNHDATIQAIGFGLAIGVCIDAFIVRMTLVPAVMTLLGARAWWIPKWLDRVLPHVSIEGEAETKRE